MLINEIDGTKTQKERFDGFAIDEHGDIVVLNEVNSENECTKENSVSANIDNHRAMILNQSSACKAFLSNLLNGQGT